MLLLKTTLCLFAIGLTVEDIPAQTLQLPPRSPDARSRDKIIQALTPLSRESREDTLFRLVMEGNVPNFMRALVPVTSSSVLRGTRYSVTYYVTPDYLAVGSDDAYFVTPMTPILAQRLADSLRCTLPTRKMVNDIYAAAPLKLAPAPIPPSPEMITVPVFARHDSMVCAQRALQLGSYPQGTLVGGTKKDVVISNLIRNNLKTGVPKPVVIYGWHQLDGVPIQPLYNGHGETYADYSHGVRLVQESVALNGSATTVSAILKDDTLAAILSDEGPIPIPRYGDTPTEVEPAPAPQGAIILRNFPNPFNPTTAIEYAITRTGDQGPGAREVRLTVYDMLGREVALLVDEIKAPGNYEVTFNASGLSSGVYLYRLTTGSSVQTNRMVVVR